VGIVTEGAVRERSRGRRSIRAPRRSGPDGRTCERDNPDRESGRLPTRRPRGTQTQAGSPTTAGGPGVAQGARAHGFGTDLWTLPRIATVIERLTGVWNHPSHVWKILGAMNWTLQGPARCARERQEEGVRRWVAERWPVAKEARRRKAWILFQDESAASERPAVRRARAPHSETRS